VIPHLGIREKQYKLIYFYTANEWEFYDLTADPQEQKNLINIPKYQSEIKRMKMRLVDVKKQYKDAEPAGELK
jgi:N-sulfoglucosamine sulfohydrolase-like protein